MLVSFVFQSSGGSNSGSFPRQPKPYGLMYNDYSRQSPMKTYNLSRDDPYASGYTTSNPSFGSYEPRNVTGDIPDRAFVRYEI